MKDLIVRADEIVKPSVKAAIQNDSNRIIENYNLIKLDGKARIPFSLEKLVCLYNGITTNQVLQAIHLK